MHPTYYNRLHPAASQPSNTSFDFFREPQPIYYDRHTPIIDKSSIISFNHSREPFGSRNNYSHNEINQEFYNSQLREACTNSPQSQRSNSIFKFQKPNQLPTGIFEENAYKEQKENERQRLLNSHYNIPKAPYRVVKFPDIEKNDNSNILHVSKKGEVAIGIDDDVFVFSNFSLKDDPETHTLREIQKISCVHWMPDSNIIFSGDANEMISLLDAETGDELTQHQYSVGKVSCATSSSQGTPVVYFGTMKGLIEKIDIRQERAELLGEGSPISAMAISPDNLELAIGTTTGELKVYDLRTGTNSFATPSHQSSIKALSWAPWEKNTVFVGGGIADPTLKVINVLAQKTLTQDQSVNCEITAIHPCDQKGKLVTCYGNAQGADLQHVGTSVVWDYSDNFFNPLAQLKGERPVSFSSLNPEKTELLTLNEDEKIRLWKIEKPKQNTPEQKSSVFHNNVFRSLR